MYIPKLSPAAFAAAAAYVQEIVPTVTPLSFAAASLKADNNNTTFSNLSSNSATISIASFSTVAVTSTSSGISLSASESTTSADQTTLTSTTSAQTSAPSVALSQVSELTTASVQTPVTTAGAVPTSAPKAAGPVEASALPNGISVIAPFDISDYCKQFIGINGVIAGNGSQLKTGGVQCSSTPIGLITDSNHILSTLIVSPAYGSTIDASVNNAVNLRTNNLVAGFFDNANTEYYIVPATHDGRLMQGHQHVTVQILGDASAPLDPHVFAFFKGVNDAEVDPDRRSLSAVIPAGTLKVDGTYRICTISGSDGHQPAVSVVVKRGSQDDCIRVNVEGSVNSNQKVASNFVSTVNSATNNNNNNNGKDTSATIATSVNSPGSTAAFSNNGNSNVNDNASAESILAKVKAIVAQISALLA